MMNKNETIAKAIDAMKICNACRYCESYCAVFDAMELKRSFSESDIYYLANLCHDCRGCYYSCQYAPPHEFDLNIPKTFSKIRAVTYRKFSWPPNFSLASFKYGGLLILLSVLSITGVLWGLFSGGKFFFSDHPDNSFYSVIPEAVIIWISAALFLFALISFVKSFGSFRSYISGSPHAFRLKPLIKTVADILTLRYLDGFGEGCNYEDESFSNWRRWMHQMILYGFVLTFIATTAAAFYEHLLHIKPPYSYFSLPVILGTSGGALQIAGIIGMFWLKLKSDKAPYYEHLIGFEISFSLLLFFVNLSGFLVLFLRETSAAGTIFTVHIGLVWTLFLYLPYSKFAHAIYRSAALLYFHKSQR